MARFLSLLPTESVQAQVDARQIYGLGGVVLPFVGIKAIDLVLTAIGLA